MGGAPLNNVDLDGRLSIEVERRVREVDDGAFILGPTFYTARVDWGDLFLDTYFGVVPIIGPWLFEKVQDDRNRFEISIDEMDSVLIAHAGHVHDFSQSVELIGYVLEEPPLQGTFGKISNAVGLFDLGVKANRLRKEAKMLDLMERADIPTWAPELDVLLRRIKWAQSLVIQKVDVAAANELHWGTDGFRESTEGYGGDYIKEEYWAY